MTSASSLELGDGLEWLVDAFGCTPEALRDPARLGQVFERAVKELGLCPLGPAQFHTFPEPGGVTGMLMLSESHLTCHSFPERGFVAFNLYCCRVRPDWPWAKHLAELLGADEVRVRRLERPTRSDGDNSRNGRAPSDAEAA
jgi:S-adenosylmethionine decarboxylase